MICQFECIVQLNIIFVYSCFKNVSFRSCIFEWLDQVFSGGRASGNLADKLNGCFGPRLVFLLSYSSP
jgi:hypothetical protein